jgi:hypothetical protein
VLAWLIVATRNFLAFEGLPLYLAPPGRIQRGLYSRAPREVMPIRGDD